MFTSLFEKGKPVFDPALGDRLGKSILYDAKDGKFNTLLEKVAPLRIGEWDRRAFYIDLACKHLPNYQSIETLSDTPLGNLIRGSAAINFAWKARGGGVANTVSENSWKLFHKNLEDAGKYLLRSAEQDPADPTAFAFLQTVAQGLQLDRKISDSWFNEAVRRDPINQQAHYRHLFLLCKKWGGSHEDMYAFARSTMGKIPENSTLHSLIYITFQEHFLYLKAFDKDIEGARAFIRNENMREESLRVYQYSLQKRKSIDRVSDYWPHNLAVFWFLFIGIAAPVRAETKKIGPYFTEYPWSMFYKDPAVGYQKALNM